MNKLSKALLGLGLLLSSCGSGDRVEQEFGRSHLDGEGRLATYVWYNGQIVKSWFDKIGEVAKDPNLRQRRKKMGEYLLSVIKEKKVEPWKAEQMIKELTDEERKTIIEVSSCGANGWRITADIWFDGKILNTMGYSNDCYPADSIPILRKRYQDQGDSVIQEYKEILKKYIYNDGPQ